MMHTQELKQLSELPELPELPDELILNIIERLPLQDIISFMMTAKKMNRVAKDKSLWSKFSARNFEDFVTRIKAVPERYKQYRKLILTESTTLDQNIYTLDYVENLLKILSLPLKEALKELMTINAFKILKEQKYGSDPQMLTMNSSSVHIVELVQALQEGLITIEQAGDKLTDGHLQILLSPGGIDALKQKLITPEQAIAMPERYLGFLLSPGGIDALKEKLITLEQAVAMPKYLYCLLSFEGQYALRERLITPEQAAAMPTVEHLRLLLEPEGIRALKEKLITPEEVAVISQAEEVMKLIINKIAEANQRSVSSVENTYKTMSPR